jgi:hypothetical protein
MRKTTIWIVIAIVVLIAAAVTIVRMRRPPRPAAIDLVAMFPDAEKRTTMPSLHDAFAVETVTIDGVTRRSILALPSSRIIWTIDVPQGAVLKTSFAIRPDAWPWPGDGAVFRVGISDKKEFHDFVRQWVNPYGHPKHQHWFDASVDLTPYAGKRVEVIFNTEPGPSNNAVYDAAVWGDPKIERQ